MELKRRSHTLMRVLPPMVLIVLYGIETHLIGIVLAEYLIVLIVLYGIETS